VDPKAEVYRVQSVEPKDKTESSVPAVLYHGTSKEAAERIMRRGFKPKITNGQLYGSGVYLAPNREDTAQFGDAIIEVHANLRNPYELDMDKYSSVEEWYDEIQNDVDYPLLDEYGEAVTVHHTDYSGGSISKLTPESILAAEAITALFQGKGYDGIIVSGGDEPDQVVVFDPAQITLAGHPESLTSKIVKCINGIAEGADVVKIVDGLLEQDRAGAKTFWVIYADGTRRGIIAKDEREARIRARELDVRDRKASNIRSVSVDQSVRK
jgi:hypothetical protein